MTTVLIRKQYTQSSVERFGGKMFCLVIMETCYNLKYSKHLSHIGASSKLASYSKRKYSTQANKSIFEGLNHLPYRNVNLFLVLKDQSQYGFRLQMFTCVKSASLA